MSAPCRVVTAAIVVWLWAWSPVAVLLILTGLYAAAGIGLYLRLTGLLRNWQTLSATLDQLRKDRACFCATRRNRAHKLNRKNAIETAKRPARRRRNQLIRSGDSLSPHFAGTGRPRPETLARENPRLRAERLFVSGYNSSPKFLFSNF